VGKINWGRVLLAGLAAGLVLNVIDWLVQGLWLMDDWAAAMQALGKAGEMSAGMAVLFVVWDFVFGIFLAWLYAAIRPRFGPGPKTAVLAGLALWFLYFLMHAIGEAPMGLFPTRLYVISVLVGIVEMALAGLAAGYVYKEEPAAA
jgi:hypothetical protein